MFEYKSEIVKAASFKLFSTKANECDMGVLDGVINQRATEGWELVSYVYSSSPIEPGARFIVTFRKGK